jgi:hypothetical protein
MSLIQELKSRYPLKGFSQDPETAVISFVHDDMCITDPFSSDCSRFEVLPTMEYHITMADAILIFDHNLPLEATFSNGPQDR